MLTLLEFENFRCFGSHKVPLRPLTIIVGRNNAGKSTVAEGLRLISLISDRYWTSHSSDVPNWLDIPRVQRGISPSLRGYEFNFETAFHGYSHPPASMRASFDDGSKVTAYIGPGNQVYGTVLDEKNQPIPRRPANQGSLLNICILPQIGPLLREEELLDRDYVRRSMSTALASLHFRNELLLERDLFAEFSELASNTWPGLKVDRPELTRRDGKQYVNLLVRDGGFTAEAAWMGHGLQMWLQVMWFLARSSHDSTVVLDEPDVYMHPDLQRKVVRLVSQRYAQTIIATHSVEIISEVDPDSILVVDRRRRASSYANTLPGVQNIIDRIGGVHNVHLARLGSVRRCVFVEGDDLKILKHVYDRLFPSSLESLEILPNMDLGGWDGWNYAVGSSMLLKDAVGAPIKIYCVFDRDYRSEEIIEERCQSAAKAGIELHVWEKKEIENYFLVPSNIVRAIRREVPNGLILPTEDEVSDELTAIAERLRDSTTDLLAQELLQRKQVKNLKEANSKARVRVAASWKSLEGRLAIISGKEAISQLSSWAQKNYKVSLSVMKLAREIERGEIDSELSTVLSAIQAGRNFI